MATHHDPGQGHELSDLAPIAVRRSPSPFRTTGRRTAPVRPLPTIPELLSGSSSSSSSSSSLPSPTPSPSPTPEALGTCYVCLARKEPGELVRGDPTDPRFPLASRCLACIDGTASGLDVGRRHELASGEGLWVCRWCGGAERLAPGEEWDGVGFHEGPWRCGAMHARALRDYAWMSAVQWLLLLVLGGVCFGTFPDQGFVKQDVFALFFVSSFASVFGLCRAGGKEVYHLPLVMELDRLMVLAVLLCSVVRESGFDRLGDPWESFPVDPLGAEAAILVTTGLMFHALLCCLGHATVFFEWKSWRRTRPGMSLRRRLTERIMFLLVVLADPFVIEQGPPKSWLRGLRDSWRVFRGRERGLPR